MKKLIFCLALVLLARLALAYPLMIQSWDLAQDVNTINALNLSIDTVNRLTGSIIVDVRGEQEEDLLLQHGFAATRIPDQAREYYEHLIATTLGSDNPLNAYYSLAELHSFLQDIQDTYPDLCQLIQYGSSVQNRPLYALKISDNVSQNEAEPEVKLVANIHGDEPIGYDMMIRTIELLTSDYGLDPRITDIVNNTELWIIPMMNPDGYANGIRYNAAGVDLNRNFPMPNGINNPDGNPHAPENLAMMDFSNQHNFVCGLSFHSGSLVMNYPWDYTYALAADNELLIDLSLSYSQHNLPM
ncbi:MAG: M14 family zinc carboxypeptidase, partial [Candidatus Cloacimonetes bacterium]|nr:M14 family zinc carboxypeptidase [Candidatus Cloacimonadota bacterium]